MKNTDDLILSYLELRAKVDKRGEELTTQHGKQLKCRKGCDSCCESINVFPIEFYAIQNALKEQKIALPKRKFNRFRKSCMFLVDGACSIYQVRPFICRTQGLPLMYQNMNGEGYEVSHCQLNFKGVDITSFTVENTMFMPDFNSQLFMLNKEFVELNNIENKNPTKRIPLYKL